MNDDQREAVRSNALYLQQVRPIDPEEIHEYVPDDPHPAVVRQVLREEAVDLGLIERANGTFVPANERPITADFDGVEGLPSDHETRLEDLLGDAFGPDWPVGDSGDGLRERIREIKGKYFVGESVEYDELTALGYAIYHLPAYYATAQYVFADLATADRLPGVCRVVDVGAGVGGPALGVFDLLPADTLVEYHAVEPSPAADVLESMLADVGPNVHVSIHRETAEAFEPGAAIGRSDQTEAADVVLFSNVLSELRDPTAVTRRYLDVLARDGTMVAIEPADRNTAIGLREVERELADDGPARVYAPTLRLWPGSAPESESWSFDVKPDLAVPAFQRRLDEAATGADHEPGEFVNVDVQYAYSLITRDGTRAHGVRASHDWYARMADADELVTQRVNLLAVKLSHDLADGGNPLFLIGDGSERTDHYAVLIDRSSLTDPLANAAYGDVLHLENALVLWNDDEGAYNVVVDEEAVVEHAATGE